MCKSAIRPLWEAILGGYVNGLYGSMDFRGFGHLPIIVQRILARCLLCVGVRSLQGRKVAGEKCRNLKIDVEPVIRPFQIAVLFFVTRFSPPALRDGRTRCWQLASEPDA